MNPKTCPNCKEDSLYPITAFSFAPPVYWVDGIRQHTKEPKYMCAKCNYVVEEISEPN